MPEVPGAMAHSKPFVARSSGSAWISRRTGRGLAQTARLQRWENWSASTRGLRVYLDSCVKCGACTDKCHYFLGTGDPKNMPVARQDLLRKVYRRYFTFAGKYFPWLVGAVDLTEEVLDEWYSYFHQCSQCRRCSVYCPYGIDTAEISMAAREILDGRISAWARSTATRSSARSTRSVTTSACQETCPRATPSKDLEEDIEDETGLEITVRLPLSM